MSDRNQCAVIVRYKIKDNSMAAMLQEIHNMLDLCAGESTFIAGFLHSTPERPDEILLYELWRGTKEDFAINQENRPYRLNYLRRAKLHVLDVHVEWNIPIAEWGRAHLLHE